MFKENDPVDMELAATGKIPVISRSTVIPEIQIFNLRMKILMRMIPDLNVSTEPPAIGRTRSIRRIINIPEFRSLNAEQR